MLGHGGLLQGAVPPTLLWTWLAITNRSILRFHIYYSALTRSRTLDFQAGVLGSSPGHGWSLPLSFISLGVGTAWQVISQGGKAKLQDFPFWLCPLVYIRTRSLESWCCSEDFVHRGP